MFVITINCFASVKSELIVYTIQAYAADWAIGPIVKKIFEQQYNCNLNYVVLDNSGTLISRLKLQKSHLKGDLVIGLDANNLSQAQKLNIFTDHNIDLSRLSLPVKWDNKQFLPYDYGFYSFVYNKNLLKNPPTSFKDIIDKNYNVIITDPRTCGTGLGLLGWFKSLYNEDSNQNWEKFTKNIVTITKSWGEAYALFLKKEADLVLAYTTSPLYHQLIENDKSYKAINFSEGNFIQIETIAKLKNSVNSDLADQFIEFVLSEKFQELTLRYNYMYPVINHPKNSKNNLDELIKQPEVKLYFAPEYIDENRNVWISEWLNIW
jgi:thiamine transport system substrate-binding protein